LKESGLAIFALVLVVSVPYVYGQENPIIVDVEKTHYFADGMIDISGSVKQILFGEDVRLMIIGPNGNVVFIDKLKVDANKQFQIETPASDEFLKEFGTYTVFTRYGSENDVATDTFSFVQKNKYLYSNESKRNILLNFDFVNYDKKNIQEHVDYKMTVSKNGVDVFGPTKITHSATGSVSVPMIIAERQSHDVFIEINGILFQPIPAETSNFRIVTGGDTLLSEFTSMNSLKINLAIDKNPSPVPKIVPSWVKNNAKWWAEDTIDDVAFTQAIQYLITKNIITIPDLPYPASWMDKNVPSWVKNNASWWADDLIPEDEFIKGIKFLIEKGIIQINRV